MEGEGSEVGALLNVIEMNCKRVAIDFLLFLHLSFNSFIL